MNFTDSFPSAFFLETERVLLRPMKEDDINDFFPITRPEFLWKYFTKELNDPGQLISWVTEALSERASGKRIPFTIVEKNSGNVCGSTSFGNLSWIDKRIEIGWSWLGEQYLSSGINGHCKYAMLKHAFEEMHFERVEIKTDNLNERAKHALQKIGAVEEGVLRSHMQMPHNRRRDSVYYSILRNEWEKVKADHFQSIV